MADTEHRQGRERRADPRPGRTRDRVLQAARMIIASDGQAAVTPTRLVEMSGVARSTIYRHWSDASSIVADALRFDGREAVIPATGDPEIDLRAYLRQLRDFLESPGAAIVVGQAEVAERDDQAAVTLEGNARHRNALISGFLDDPRTDFDAVHAQLVGPLFVQRYFLRKPITDALIELVIDSYLATRPETDVE